MSEQTIRHRGEVRDENGQIVQASSNDPLTALRVAPGGGTPYVDGQRDGETTAFTVYYAPGTDLVNADELTVRGNKFGIIVNDWDLDGKGGLEVLCTRGQG